ncbi:MAG: nucleotidyl transferase AbiEii/AbiGii toxin family protein, partial [Clostridiales bacterium]|nr:nucleotidyl transferase AbiEii/AbiGii toxin family protein [Clostridiales bacterium]
EGFYSPSINTYSLESTIAEKLDAILSMMELSSRMKDYYDIYYLSCKFNFDNKILAEAIRKTFENRERSFTIDDFKRIMTFAENEDMLRKWNMFIMKLELDIHIEFEEVLSKMNVLLSPVFKTITTKKE